MYEEKGPATAAGHCKGREGRFRQRCTLCYYNIFNRRASERKTVKILAIMVVIRGNRQHSTRNSSIEYNKSSSWVSFHNAQLLLPRMGLRTI